MNDLWETFQLECCYVWSQVRDFFYDIYYFFKNLRLFSKDLWRFRPWDHEYCRDIYCTALEILKEEIYRNGHEVDEDRLKKVNDMEELLRLLQIDVFDALYENKLFVDVHTKKGMNKFNKLYAQGEKARYKRICELLKESETWWD